MRVTYLFLKLIKKIYKNQILVKFDYPLTAFLVRLHGTKTKSILLQSMDKIVWHVF